MLGLFDQNRREDKNDMLALKGAIYNTWKDAIHAAKKPPLQLQLDTDFMNKFYQRIRSVKRGKVPISRKNHKGYDCIARLLTVNETCIAVTFYDDKIFVATNQNHHPMNAPIRSRLTTLLDYCYEVKYKFGEILNEKYTPSPARAEFIKQMLTPKIDLFISTNNATQTLSSAAHQRLLNTFEGFIDEYHDHFQDLYANSLRKGESWQKAWSQYLAEQAEIDKNISQADIYEQFIVQFTRAIVDIIQLETIIRNEPDAEITRFSRNNEQRETIFITTGEPNEHAELRLLAYLLNNELGGSFFKPTYIGISKLCCPLCMFIMRDYTQQIDDGYEAEDPYFRGAHANMTRWRIPENFKSDDRFLNAILGDELFNYLQQHGDKMLTIRNIKEPISVKTFLLQVVETIGAIRTKLLKKLHVDNIQKITDIRPSAQSVSTSRYEIHERTYDVIECDGALFPLFGDDFDEIAATQAGHKTIYGAQAIIDIIELPLFMSKLTFNINGHIVDGKTLLQYQQTEYMALEQTEAADTAEMAKPTLVDFAIDFGFLNELAIVYSVLPDEASLTKLAESISPITLTLTTTEASHEDFLKYLSRNLLASYR